MPTIFDKPEPGTWWQGPARSWPSSSMTTTTVEQVKKQAEVQQKQQEDKFDELPPLGSLDSDWPEPVIEGVADAMPSPMSFFAGRNYAEGRAAYNQYRKSAGLPLISEGRR